MRSALTVSHDPILVTHENGFADLDRALQRERAWFRSKERFTNRNSIYMARNMGALALVESKKDFQLVARFNDRRPGFEPFLSEVALQVLILFGEEWRLKMKELKVEEPDDRELRLAVTSLTRHTRYQEELVNSGNTLASPDSTHCVGYAFDIDAAGYYSIKGGDVYSHVDPVRQERRADISRQLQKENGSKHLVVQVNEYDERVVQASRRALTDMHEQGLVNLVMEDLGNGNECNHVAVYPCVEFDSGIPVV